VAGASAGVQDPMRRRLGETRPYNGSASVSSTSGNGRVRRRLGETRPYNGSASVSSTSGNGRGVSSCEATGDRSVGDGGVILQKQIRHTGQKDALYLPLGQSQCKKPLRFL
jgi:hypothetical protein